MPAMLLLHYETDNLLKCPRWAGLDEPQRARILAHGKVVRVPNGRSQVIGGGIFVVVSGAMKLSRTMDSGNQVVVGVFEPGCWFGNLGGEKYSAEGLGGFAIVMVALPDVLQLCVDAPAILPLIFDYAASLERRLSTSLESLSDLSAPRRLARLLRDLGKRFGVATVDGTKIALRISQAELADLAGASRQRVNLYLRRLEKDGLLRQRGGHLELCGGFDENAANAYS